MRQYRFVCGLLLVLFISGCASAPQPGPFMTHDAACHVDHNDQRVSMMGYPRLSGMTLVTDDFSVDLFEQPNGGGAVISVYFTVGSGPNQAEALPDDYTDEDLRIHTSSNEVVSSDTRIRVHGTLSAIEATPGEIVCFVSAIDLIEIAPEA